MHLPLISIDCKRIQQTWKYQAEWSKMQNIISYGKPNILGRNNLFLLVSSINYNVLKAMILTDLILILMTKILIFAIYVLQE